MVVDEQFKMALHDYTNLQRWLMVIDHGISWLIDGMFDQRLNLAEAACSIIISHKIVSKAQTIFTNVHKQPSGEIW